MTEKEWLGEDNQLGIDIWKNKYCYEGEDFEAWLDRICGGDSEVIDLVKNKKFLFGGRILSNRGLQNKGKKSACPTAMSLNRRKMKLKVFLNVRLNWRELTATAADAA